LIVGSVYTYEGENYTCDKVEADRCSSTGHWPCMAELTRHAS
jgi:hypothetical protein